MKLLIATKNPGKFSEIAEVLQTIPLELLSLNNLGIQNGIEETGGTHEENAILKASYFFEKTGLPTMGEDSGIHIDAFPGELGVFTRRWGGLEAATDLEWIEYFLKKMEHVPEEKRGAKFVCCAAVILDKSSMKQPFIFYGETHGVITENLEAPIKSGIPLSSCFRPIGFEKVYAALTPKEKNKISHRGKAMQDAKEFLAKFLL